MDFQKSVGTLLHNSTIIQARKIQLNIWSSEDDQDTKSGRPQECVVVLKCIPLPGPEGGRKI